VAACGGGGGRDGADATVGAADTGSGTVDARPRADAGRTSVDARVRPDAAETLPACRGADATYDGALIHPSASEGNPLRPDLHYLRAFGQLDASGQPDNLIVAAFYKTGVDTGTFRLPAGSWTASICVNFDRSRSPACETTLVPVSGTIEITSVVDRLTGSLAQGVFVDDRDTPTCAATVTLVSFDEAIECAGPGDC